MKFTLAKVKTVSESDLLLVCTFKAKAKKNAKPFDCKAVLELDKELSGQLTAQAQNEGFVADEGSSFSTFTFGKKGRSISLLGLGETSAQSVDLFRKAGGEAFKIANKKQAKKLSLVISEKTTIALFDVVQALTEGMILASYRFDKYRTKDPKETYLKEVEFHLPEAPTAELKQAITHAEEIAHGVCLARDLINDGPTELNPQKFTEHALKAAKDAGLNIEVLDEKKLLKERMGLMLAVARAAQSFAPPRLIRIHYKPKKASAKKVVIVGKGVTFDCGGLDIKTADGMLDMKVDMSGAACILGTMHAVAKLKPDVEVIGYMAMVENGIGPAAYHPGDIIVSRKGTTVEISNTDAEGRLILADAIDYATEREKPDTIIDVATLTGACMVALGPKTAGIFSNDDALCESICRSGEAVGEAYWRMPLTLSLRDNLKSPVADMRNCGDRLGGAITAALFIEEFIAKDIKWAHLDIAGPATNSKSHPYLSIGGVGFGIRTLVDHLMGE